VRTAFIRVACFLLFGNSGLMNSHAETPAPAAWWVIWLPWQHTYSSWNWTKDDVDSIAIQDDGVKFPDFGLK
jgi:hypothetical protein